MGRDARAARAAVETEKQAQAGPALSPAEFATALTELHVRPSLQSLCDAAAHLGSAALGPTWVTLLASGAEDEPLRAAAASGPNQARWPVEPPQIEAAAVPGLLTRIGERGATGRSVAEVCGDTLPDEIAAALQDALRPRFVALAPVVVDGRHSGIVFVAVDGRVPEEAVTALAEHAAAAMRRLLQIDLLRTHGDLDPESGVLGRAALEQTVAREMMRARRYGRPLTLVVLRPGEPGTPALRVLGEALASIVRATDIVTRLDEAHLAVLLPETDQDGGQTFVVRVLGRLPGVYASAANYPADGVTWEALLAAALTTEGLLAAAPVAGAAAIEAPTPEGPYATRSFRERLTEAPEDDGGLAPLPDRPARTAGPPGGRFARDGGSPPRLRDAFPNFQRHPRG